MTADRLAVAVANYLSANLSTDVAALNVVDDQGVTLADFASIRLTSQPADRALALPALHIAPARDETSMLSLSQYEVELGLRALVIVRRGDDGHDIYAIMRYAEAVRRALRNGADRGELWVIDEETGMEATYYEADQHAGALQIAAVDFVVRDTIVG